ncbi:ligand-gated channel [Geotalea uraniireducens]|uniref:Ligand-gated channel n=1 Tax=Geotalea uraniireducens TaxID=351604 RepID=A0ABM8EJ33_9BACT|nr:TonB-dependent receptor [Geotalea uraniireducens]BDV42384.1 ligand-gated channel [Geotalea uraniireducens]
MKLCDKAGLLLVLAGLALPGTGVAENLMLDEIVVRGETESPREETLSIREVRESPAKDVGEALKQLEGLAIVRKGAIANDVVLRGLQRDNINVLVDGVRVYGACPNRMDPPSFHYDFAEIEEIKVVKGPYDLENAGSLGGTVETVTKKPQPGFSSDLTLGYGSYDSVNASATASYGADRFDGLLGYAFKYSGVPEAGDGKLITDIYPATNPNRYRADTLDSKAYEINTGWAKFGLRPTAKSRMELGYSYQDAEHVLYPYLKMDADYDRTHRLNWRYRATDLTGPVKAVHLQAYWDRVSHLMDDSLRQSAVGKARDYSMQTDARSQVVGAKANATAAVGPGSLKGGADYYSRNWDALNVRAAYTAAQPYAPLNMIPDVFVDNLGLFAEYELPLAERVKLRGGVRGDLTWIRADKANNATAQDDRTDFAEVSGNLQLTWTPASGVELFAGLGRGVRTPDPEELYIDVPAMAPAITWRGNPALRPTVNHQADLGVKYATGRYYVSASLFYSRLDDYVNLAAVSTALKSYRNIDASLWGAEFGSQVSLPADLYLKGSLSYTEGENRDDHRPLAEIPPLKGSLALRYDVERWFVEAVQNFTARQDRVDSGLNEQETAGWLTTDLKAGVKYDSLSLYGGVNNLLDNQYYSHLSYQRDPFASGVGFKVPENGRNFYLTVAYAF